MIGHKVALFWGTVLHDFNSFQLAQAEKANYKTLQKCNIIVSRNKTHEKYIIEHLGVLRLPKFSLIKQVAKLEGQSSQIISGKREEGKGWEWEAP